MVEFALILPVFAVLLFGGLYASITLWQASSLSSAVHAGARAGAWASGDCNVAQDVARRNHGPLNESDIDLDCQLDDSGDLVLAGTYPVAIPIIGWSDRARVTAVEPISKASP